MFFIENEIILKNTLCKRDSLYFKSQDWSLFFERLFCFVIMVIREYKTIQNMNEKFDQKQDKLCLNFIVTYCLVNIYVSCQKEQTYISCSTQVL